MKLLIVINLIWFVACTGLIISEGRKRNKIQQELDNYKEMEKFYLRHIEFCDTLHQECFKLTKGDAG